MTKQKTKKNIPVLSALGKFFGAIGRGIKFVFIRIQRFLRRLFSVRATRSLKGDVFVTLFLVLFCAIMFVPMLYVICNAFKPYNELFRYPPRFFVYNPTLDNFTNLSIVMSNSYVPFTRYLFNTVLITVAGTGLHVIFASMAAYSLEKIHFRGQNAFFSLVVVALLFTPNVTSIPNFIIMSRLHLVDTYWALIMPAIGSAMGLFLMKQFMSSIHNAMLEAARIDGASELKIFFSIVMPNVKPAWLTLIIFSANDLWNNTGGVLIRTEEIKPLAFALQQISLGGLARAGVAGAISVVLMSVPIILFIATQSQVLDTMASSGIKE
ncbi:MAG: carbohydrate ABC transporter permease [Clostridia bacterium]|nr:carbohydrate ABC transporter permease [Clostridia bacterium]